MAPHRIEPKSACVPDRSAQAKTVRPGTVIPFETDRLIFRDWTASDLGPFHSICSDPSVMQFVGDGVPWSMERNRQWIEGAGEMSKKCGYCQWALVLKATSALVGFCGFVPADDGAEIGWRLAKSCWGQGLATEAARTVLKHGFDILGFQRVIATVQTPNRASIRVCEKLGMKLETRTQRNGREVIQFSISRL